MPLIPAEYQQLIELYPWFASFFPADVVDFVARPVIEILAPDGTVLAQNGDPTAPGYVPNPADRGSAFDGDEPGTTVDPFLEYLFDTPGTYYVRVGSYKQWDEFTRGGLANTFTSDGLEGVATGTGYSLLASVQRHDTNADAITLVGKTLTIIAGKGKGQQAVITGYNPEYRITNPDGSFTLDEAYTLDKAFTITPDATSRFEIADTPTIPPVDDSYDLVLTGTPGTGKTVIVDVLPRPTRTYDADQAFNPAANFGEAEEVQVEVATGRARLKLTGSPAFGERWIVKLNDQSFGYDVQSGDTLADVAARSRRRDRRLHRLRREHRRRRPDHGRQRGRRERVRRHRRRRVLRDLRDRVGGEPDAVARHARRLQAPDRAARLRRPGGRGRPAAHRLPRQPGAQHLAGGARALDADGRRRRLPLRRAVPRRPRDDRARARLAGPEDDLRRRDQRSRHHDRPRRRHDRRRDDPHLARQRRRRDRHAAGRLHRQRLGRAPHRARARGRRRLRRRRRRARLPGARGARQRDPRPDPHRRRRPRRLRALPQQPAAAAGRDERAASPTARSTPSARSPAATRRSPTPTRRTSTRRPASARASTRA